MSLPTLRPGLLPPPQPPTYPTTPPPTSPASSPHKEGPFGESTQTPQPHHEHILLAQEAAEDRRLRAQAEQIWRDSQEYSCAEDNETTPWLQHTKWPELFRNRPVDIIAASARQPAQGPNQNNEDYVLGVWRGVPLRSPAAAEARLRLLMRAVDDIFDRAEATLACTSYRSRCWLSSYWQETFCNRPLRILPRRTREKYKSRWKHFTCYLFRAFALKPRQRREIYNVPLRADEIAMMRHILDLVSQLKGEEEEEEEAEEEEAYGDWSNQGEGSEGEEEDEEEDRAEADGYDESDGEGDNHDNDGAGEEDDEEGKDEQDYAPGQHTFRISRGTRLKLSEALFQLSMMFWTHQCQAGVMASSALIHFTAVMGIHPRSLAYRSAYSSTPGFAALVWIGRLFFLEYSLPLYSYTTLVQIWPARDIYPSQPERLEAIRTKHMLRGCHSPLGEILELKAFAKSIIKQEGSTGNLTWAQDGRSFTIGNDKVVELSDFCVAHHAAITRVQERVDEMMLGWKPAVDLSAIRDDLTCRLPGWCFLEKPENGLMGFYKAMARRAWSSSFRSQALAKSGHWLPGSCQAYLEAGAELTTMIFAAFHLTAGLPGRGTEATSIRLRNTKLAIRNLFIREGQVLIIISYNKARASNNYA